MKSGFIELVVKRVIGGRAIKLQQKTPRYKPIDSFKQYITQTLPQMQQSIQINLLKKSLPKIKDSIIRKQLINSYLRRLFRLRTYQKQQIKSYKQLTANQSQAIGTIVDPTIIKKINQHTQYDIGSYCLFSQQDMKKVFKHGCFGRYTDQQYASTQKFGVQIREQCISISAIMKLIMKRIQLLKNNKNILEELNKLSQQQILQKINNQQLFPIYFMQISNIIYKYSQKYRSHIQYSRTWGSSVISDIITNSILKNKNNKQFLSKIQQNIQKIVDTIMKIQLLPAPNDFSYRFKIIPGSPQNNPITTQIQLPQHSKYYSRTPSFKSIFLGGQGGTGKSMILTYLSMYAYKNNWLVINVPNVYKWTFDRKIKYIRAYNGLYLINQHAVEWLDQFITANKEILQKKNINQQIYGKCDITGVSQNQAQPVPNIYYPERRAYFNQISDKFTSRVIQQQQQMRKQAKKRLTNILQKPKNLYQIGLAGIKNPQYATCAMGQLLKQVYQIQDIPILQCIDSFSYLYRATCYPSFRYYNDRNLWGRIPPYHLAHCRLFVHLDGHKIKNGMKIVASSNYPMYMHKFNIKKMLFPQNYQHKVRNLTQQQFKNAGQFNVLCGWWQADQVQRLNINYAYTITQGNWGDFQQLMKLGHYY